ncbi:hypothetical protein LNAOJCKE_0379 [Methylorubrum aminovorans]|uniref:Uncharacterized protein n=1 Tax=Methylorubrum aminovorans TaxID=269069 RepID=A0ABQ4UBN5_9HYPH|nr:hypothetical protein [Methylorubrum aminovorans]GJE63185.1 hypothetical protein LNAOJCKE_0379 [Methylorubrum aminovorans]GMA79229.1 hypothetical protein GCM10025880_56460 [Methylorubrum aminovorans]
MKYILHHMAAENETWLVPHTTDSILNSFLACRGELTGLAPEEMLSRCALAGIEAVEDDEFDLAGHKIWLITVPDDDDAAFNFKMFVQP